MSSSAEERQGANDREVLPQYYLRLNSPAIQSSIRNLDDKNNFEEFCRNVSDESSQNFLVDYGDDEAYCAFNLYPECFEKLVNSEVSSASCERTSNSSYFPFTIVIR